MVRAYLQFGQANYPLPFETRSGLHVDLRTYDDLVTAWVGFC
jgi:hypothetical protein